MKKLITLSLLLFILGCDKNTTEPQADPFVEYKVTGSATSVDVTLSNASENTEQYSNKSLPYSYTFDSASGNFLYISAQNQGSSGSVTSAIYVNGDLDKKSEVPVWLLTIGGTGIVVGLATWGYKIIDRIGRELTKVTPSRGFVMELSAATTVVIASRTAIPVSTTHCQVGSVVGCGLVDGKKNIDWHILKKVIFSWIITLPVAGLISAGLFSLCHYSP